jgi:hypothetical protein
LMSWGERMVAIGLAQRPDLLAEVALAGDDKSALNKVCNRAKEAGGATIRRDLGTALHSVLEQSFTVDGYIPPAQFTLDVAAVHAAFAAHGLVVVDGMTERIVVLDDEGIAGTFDLLLRDAATGELLVADIKTGSSVAYGALAFAVQLAIYAHADAIYQQGAAADGSEDQRLPMPAVSDTHGVIVHVEPGSGVCALHRLELRWDLANLAMEVRAARSLKGLLKPLEISAGSSPWPAEGVAVEPVTALAPATPPIAADPARRAWVVDRIKDLGDHDTLALSELARLWPDGVAPLKKSTDHTDADLDAIVAVLDDVEDRFDAAFGVPDPTATTRVVTPPVIVTGTAAVTIDEGPEVDESDVDALRTHLSKLDDVHQLIVGSWTAQAADCGRSVSLRQLPSRRRWSIARAMSFLAPLEDDDIIRHCISLVMPDAEQPAIPLGAALSALTYDEANRLAEIAKAITTGALTLAFELDGRPVITGDITAYLAA